MSDHKEHGRTRPGLPFGGSKAVNISTDPNSTIIEEYRYYEKDTTPGTWFTYTGSETLAVNNNTGSNVIYIVEKRRTLYYYGYEIAQSSESWEIVIPPTPQPIVDNFSIDPAMPMSYGTWEVSFDVTYNPTWSGSDPTVELDILCYDEDSVLQKTINNVTLTKLGSTYSGNFTILESEAWEYAEVIGYGDFEADVMVSAIAGTTIPATVANHIFDGYWAGVPGTSGGDGSSCDQAILWSDTSTDKSLGSTWYYDGDIDAYGIWVEFEINDGEQMLVYSGTGSEDSYTFAVYDASDCSTDMYGTLSWYDDTCDYHSSIENWDGSTYTVRAFVGAYSGENEGWEIIMKNITSSGCP